MKKIKECSVVAVPDETWGEAVTAVVVLKEGCEKIELSELRTWGKTKLATYKVPQKLFHLDSLPRNQMGKLEKKKVIQILKENGSLG